MLNTLLALTDSLPLTCSRTGTCCYGNLVHLNPWELACLAREKKISAREFRDSYCDDGGTRLRFDGKAGWEGKLACSLYEKDRGCSVHVGRPLACRLFPLGRQIQNNETVYMYQGADFPCLDGCSEVLGLPHLTVADYLVGQQSEKYEIAQDAYLELLQGLADIAFELLLDSGLAESGDTETLAQWRLMGNESSSELVGRIGKEWLDFLMVPNLEIEKTDPAEFCQQHFEIMQLELHNKVGNAQTYSELHVAAVLVMAVALLLAISLGVNTYTLSDHWIATAKSYGAME